MRSKDSQPETHLSEIERQIEPSLGMVNIVKNRTRKIPSPDARSLVEVEELEALGHGSSFFITADGWMVTNKHVIDEKKADFVVQLADGTFTPIILTFEHPDFDFAIVKVDGSGYQSVELGDSRSLRARQKVHASGFPLGQETVTTTTGSVITPPNLERLPLMLTDESLTDAEIKRARSAMIAIDAPVHHGNSGGPLLDEEGRVIGINTNVQLGFGTGAIGHAIPIHSVENIIKNPELYAWIGAHFNVIKATLQSSDDAGGISRLQAYQEFLQVIRKTAEGNEPVSLEELITEPAVQGWCKALTKGYKDASTFRALEEEIIGGHIIFGPKEAELAEAA